MYKGARQGLVGRVESGSLARPFLFLMKIGINQDNGFMGSMRDLC